MSTQPEPTTVRDEIKALGRIAAILDTVDDATRDRIAGWVFDRYRKPADTTEANR